MAKKAPLLKPVEAKDGFLFVFFLFFFSERQCVEVLRSSVSRRVASRSFDTVAKGVGREKVPPLQTSSPEEASLPGKKGKTTTKKRCQAIFPA